MKNGVQIISYPDSLGKNLQELHFVLKRYFQRAISGVHILPFYPSTADRGFCPTKYDEVYKKYGTWDDVEKIGEEFDLVVDLIPNHISRGSKYFKDYLKKGHKSKYRDMFLQISKLYPEGVIPEQELEKIYLRKPASPEFLISFPDGKSENIWQTFESDQQIDLDINSQIYRDVFQGFLLYLLRRKVKMIRLDAIAYVTKKPRTDCFFVEPEIWEFMDWVRDFSSAFGGHILPELHAHHDYQEKLADKGYRVYDFVLPLMTLHALYEGDARNLKSWIKECPRKQVTTLDTHDGIPVVDVEDLMKKDEVDRTVEKVVELGGNISYNHVSNGDDEVYQLNITYYSALEANDNAYIAARAIQFFTPGIPQVYYVGALAGENDYDLLNQFAGTKVGSWGRDINRHYYTLEEIKKDYEKPVVQRLINLMEFRNNYKAFDGLVEVKKSEDHELIIKWSNNSKYEAILKVDLKEYKTTIDYYDVEKKVWRKMEM